MTESSTSPDLCCYTTLYQLFSEHDVGDVSTVRLFCEPRVSRWSSRLRWRHRTFPWRHQSVRGHVTSARCRSSWTLPRGRTVNRRTSGGAWWRRRWAEISRSFNTRCQPAMTRLQPGWLPWAYFEIAYHFPLHHIRHIWFDNDV